MSIRPSSSQRGGSVRSLRNDFTFANSARRRVRTLLESSTAIISLVRVRAFLAAFSVALATSVSALDSADSPRRAFALTQLTGPVATLLENPGIDGVALQIGWDSIETSDDRFEWSSLDAALSVAQERSKGVTLHVFAGGFKVSPWLVAAGAQTYSWTDPQGRAREEIVPWDEIYLAEFTEFLGALASHLASTGHLATVERISVAVPVAEMDLAACRENVRAQSYSYDRRVYLESWTRMIDAFDASFPATRKFVSAPVGLICFPERDEQFYRDVMTYARARSESGFIPFAADLTAEGSDRMAPYVDLASANGLGFQTIWSATNDPTNRMKGTYPDNLRAAVCKALALGSNYVEIYAADVLNGDPAIQRGVLALHHAELCSQGRRHRPARR